MCNVISKSFKTTLTVLFSLFSVLLGSTSANASLDIHDETDGRSMFVRIEENSSISNTSSVTNGPHRRTQAPNATRLHNPNAGSVVSDNAASSTPTVFNGSVADQAPVLSSICYYGDPLYQTRRQGAYQCREPEPEEPASEPAAEAAPAPAAPVGQAPEVVEPVEIVITSSDLLELIPASPQILMDRGPFGLKNAHTNFYASNHRPQTVTRTMFDQEVTITATPIEYRWDYGDGETLVTEVPGHPVEVFNTETETSHQYSDTGLYTVALTTVFEGTYQVDGGATQTVSSPVTQVADPVEIRIWRAVTRNVAETCLQNPNAWGC